MALAIASVCSCSYGALKDGSKSSAWGRRGSLGSSFTGGFRFPSAGFVSSPTNHKRLVITASGRRKVPYSDPPVIFERFRLDNLSPQPGSKRKRKRKGRGESAGQGNSCGYGRSGQNTRGGTRPGFRGGAKPLFRLLPKLKGIGRMKRSVKKYCIVNVRDVLGRFKDGDEVSKETLKERRILKAQGKERYLPLKILGETGRLTEDDMKKKLVVKARSFSKGARAILESAGCELIELPPPPKFYPLQVRKNRARAAAFYARKRAEAEGQLEQEQGQEQQEQQEQQQ